MSNFKITDAKFNREFQMHGSTMYSHGVKIEGSDEWMEYVSKKKDQTKFVPGQEIEATISSVQRGGNTYKKIKPVYANTGGNSNFTKSVNREQSKYSGFAMSYAKDLVTSGMLDHNLIFIEAEKMFSWMVKKDAELKNG